MSDTPIQGETANDEALSNVPGTTTAPVTDNSSANVEAAKREAEQARIRANQLENENKRLKEAQEAVQRKQLEEKEEFKTLYEQTQAQLKEIEDAQAAQERQKELATATESVLKDYPQNVVEVAKTAGISLTDDSEAAQAVLKEKLDAIQKQVGSSTPRPTANNPHNPPSAVPEHTEVLSRIKGGDTKALFEHPGVKGPIERMKQIAQNGA